MDWKMYLSGEIHTDWRQQVIDGVRANDLPVVFTSAMTVHATSDAAGNVLGGALLLWGVAEHRAGKIRGRHSEVYRDSSLLVFFLLLAGRRWLPGGIMLLAGFWLAFIRGTP